MTFSSRHDAPPELEALRQPVPVDELPDERRRRSVIDGTARAIRAERRRRVLRTRLLAAAGAAAALVAGAATWWSVGAAPREVASSVAVSATPGPSLPTPAAEAPSSELRVTAGSVVATRRGAPTAIAAGASARIDAGDTLSSGVDGAGVLLLPRGVRVEVGAATRATLAAVSDLEQRLRLDLGTTAVSVPEAGAPRTFAIVSPDAEVVVHGTEFTVRVERHGAATTTSVDVTRGAVLVRRGDSTELVRAGGSWSSRPEPRADGARAAAATPARVVERSRATTPPRLPPGALAEQNRLFQAALDARRAGDDARAVRMLDELLARFPGTPLREQARLARFRALQRLGGAPASAPAER